MAKNKFLYIILFFAVALYVVMGIYADVGKLLSDNGKFPLGFFYTIADFDNYKLFDPIY